MFTTRWQLMRLLGIPIYVDATWFIILALITLSLANPLGFPKIMHEFFPASPAPPVYQAWIMGLIAALAFFACILFHEMGHAVVARGRGMPMRGITLFLFGGVADIGDEPPSALTEFLVAVAGPVVSLVLAVGLWILAVIGYNAAWPHAVVIVLGYLAVINAIVLAFNLIPAFPLDGGRVFRSILWGITGNVRRATFWASLAGQAFAWFLIGYGILMLFNEQYIAGIWSGLIGLFLNNAARSTYQQIVVREALTGEPVRRFMTPDPIAVAPSLDLLQWVNEFVYRYHRKGFPVVADGRLEGAIDTQALADVPRAEWDQHRVREFMRDDLDNLTIAPDADAMAALRQMQREELSRLFVTEGNHLVGVISLKDLLRFLNLKLELEGNEDDKPSAGGVGSRQGAGRQHQRVTPT